MISLLIIYINAFLSSMQAIFGPMSDIRRLDDFQENYVGCDTVNEKCVLEPAFQSITIDQHTCKVCGDYKVSKYKIYGATASICNACRVFFSRASSYNLKCKCEGGPKAVNSYTRRDCKSCRYQKCISVGMSHDHDEKRKYIKGKDNGKNDVTNKMISSSKKRQTVIKFAPAKDYSLSLKLEPVLSFTVEEEFKVIDYIVRIEEHQNRQFDYLCSKFPQYLLAHAQMIKQKMEGIKITSNYNIDYMILNIGLEFTKQMCGDFYEEMSTLMTDVQSEILNRMTPATFMLMNCIAEGNTREKTCLDQQMKSIQSIKVCHHLRHLPHVPPLSLMDMEYYLPYLALLGEEEDKIHMTVSRVGRLLRDDLQLQALYHMVVMLTPSSAISPLSKQNEVLLKVRSGVVQLLYRYLSTNPNIHYRKTMGNGNYENTETTVNEERSHIMQMTSSEGLEDLSAADKTELLLKLVEDIHECVDISHYYRTLLITSRGGIAPLL